MFVERCWHVEYRPVFICLNRLGLDPWGLCPTPNSELPTTPDKLTGTARISPMHVGLMFLGQRLHESIELSANPAARQEGPILSPDALLLGKTFQN